LKKWELVQRKTILEPGPFAVREDTLVSPRTGAALVYHVLECPDWVNVVAFTEGEEMVLVRQYRFGSERFTLEIPGGVVDPDESPAVGAVRELREETGYVGEKVVELGFVEPNPALQNNRCYTYLITGCRPTMDQELDPGEDVSVELHTMSELRQMIRRGEVTHSLVVAAMELFRLHRDSISA
jgi:ADP-ribose pyrophosphatase